MTSGWILHAPDPRNLQVTDAGRGYVELRALMSVPDAPTGWDLRCAVREDLVTYVNRRHSESLPRTRVALQGRERYT